LITRNRPDGSFYFFEKAVNSIGPDADVRSVKKSERAMNEHTLSRIAENEEFFDSVAMIIEQAEGMPDAPQIRPCA